MKTSRRGLLKLSAQSLLGASLAPLVLPERAFAVEKPDRFSGNIPMVQLMTNHDSAQFAVLTDGHRPYSYRVLDSHGNKLAVSQWDHASHKGSNWEIDKLIVTGLEDGQWYRFQVYDRKGGYVADERFFGNLPLQSDRRARFALVSCAYDSFAGPAEHMWNCVGRARPEMIFFIGDTCYADMTRFFGLKNVWDRYVEARRRLFLYVQPILVPTFAIWDDHDFGCNNGDRTFKNKGSTLSIFRAFWESKEVEGYKKTCGVGFHLSGFGQRFYFMDNRSYRDRRYSKGYHWGCDQQDMLLADLDVNRDPAWLFSGSQFFGCYKDEESFMLDHPKNFVDLMQKLSRKEAPVVFGSGDVHYSETMRIEPRVLGYTTYEYTSSSIHSFLNPLNYATKNSRRLNFTPRHNFLMIESERTPKGLKISTESFGSQLESLFKHQAEVVR